MDVAAEAVALWCGLAGIAVTWVHAARRRWIWAALNGVAAAICFVAAGMDLSNAELQAAINAALAECRKAPPVVEFHRGMTLCPGQTVIVPILLPRREGRDL